MSVYLWVRRYWPLFVLFVWSLTVFAQETPLTPIANLRGRTDSSGYLIINANATGLPAQETPLTPIGNLRGRTDSSGYLLVRCTVGCTGSGSGNAPSNAGYWVDTANTTLTAERDLGALTTGLVLNTVTAGVGVPSAYGGTSCTNQFPRSLNASGAATCATVVLADTSGVAPSDATYITQTANTTLTAEQALSSLDTGIMRVATTTGVITSLTDSAGIRTNISDETGTGVLMFNNAPAVVGVVNFQDNVRQIFDPGTVNAGINVGSQAGNPASTINADLWYNSTTERLMAKVDNVNVIIGYSVSNAPSNAGYWVDTAHGDLSAERDLGALTTGLVLNTVTAGVGVPSAYAGTSCTNQFPRSLNASGAATCATVVLADTSGVAPSAAQYWVATADTTLSAERDLGALTTGLVLNTVTAGVGVPSAYGGTSCTNQFPRSLNASGTATCATVVLADTSGIAPSDAGYWVDTSNATLSAERNLGELTTGLVLNTVTAGVGVPSAYAGTSCTNQFPRSLSASGAATCATVSLTADVTGTLPVANGGTNATSWTTGSVVFASSSTALGQDNDNLFWDDTNNRLGIGTAAPTQTFDLVSSATGLLLSGMRTTATNSRAIWLLSSEAGATDVSIDIRSHGSAYSETLLGLSLTSAVAVIGQPQANGMAVGTFTNFPLILGTNNAERMRIEEGGDVGIGTTSPLYKFEVVDTGTNLTRFISTSAGALGPTVFGYHNSVSPAAADDIFFFGTAANDSGGTERTPGFWRVRFEDVTSTTMDSAQHWCVSNNENATNCNTIATLSSTGVWTDASDEFKKEYEGTAVQVWGDVLGKIRQLNTGRYHTRGLPPGKAPRYRHAGPSVQQFYSLFGLGADPTDPSMRDPETGILRAGIAAKDLAAVSLAGVQLLLDRIEALERRVEVLERRP